MITGLWVLAFMGLLVVYGYTIQPYLDKRALRKAKEDIWKQSY